LRILILNNGYLTRTPSGGDKHLLDLGDALSRQHDVTIILPNIAADLPASGLRKRTYWAWQPRSTFGIMAAYFLRGIRALGMALHERADIVLSSSGPIDILPALANRWIFGSCVVVYPFHLVPRREASGLMQGFQFAVSRLAQIYALFLMRRADVVFTDNSIVKSELVAQGIPVNRIHVQRPVVNVAQVQLAATIPRYRVVFIGRMVRSKGIYDLVDALKLVSVSAGLIGDGEERLALSEYVFACGLAHRVQVLGPLPFDDMYALLKGCDLFVFPSYEEGYGIAIAEAIAAGKPVLAYELPHYREVFNNSLITVPIGNAKMLTMRMQDFFEGRIDAAAIQDRYRSVYLASKESAADFELNIIKSARGVRVNE